MIDSDYWKHFGEELVEFLGVELGAKVLDIGTGWGAVLIPLVNVVGPEGEIFAIDLRDTAVEKTKEIISTNQFNNVKVMQMNANNLEFEDETFDFITSGFIGFCQFYDFELLEQYKQSSIFSEYFRVLRSGGRVGISTWAL
ncbi:MAG: class I SAM-dependent methyltransferase [Candidatus Heimdallarchaeota archaeon]|nr:class I SAM-dependent methyltransferase [Candidatus Heimdallarchaeota archaeon]